MTRSAITFAIVLSLSLPLISSAQKSSKAGQANQMGLIQCSRQEGYAYLYSSMATLEISTTLKCGQTVTILDRSDNYVHVRTDAGDDGFVPLSNVGFLKAGAAPTATSTAVKRELTHYDNPARMAAASRPAGPAEEIILANQRAVHLKLGRELSSETAKVGQEVNFEVAEPVIVNGRTVIDKGAPAAGTVTAAEPKGRLGKAGKLNVNVSSVQLANGEKLPLRSFGINTSNETKSGLSLPKLRGKEITFPQGAEMTAYVDGDQRLKASSFAVAPSAPQAVSQSTAAPPQN
jgi:hypothetical protein